MVPTERLELSQLSPPPPQDGVSTNSTTSAFFSAQASQDRGASPAVAKPVPACYLGISLVFESASAAGLSVPVPGAKVAGAVTGADDSGCVAMTPLLTPL